MNINKMQQNSESRCESIMICDGCGIKDIETTRMVHESLSPNKSLTEYMQLIDLA